ncbi:MAG: alpha-glucosidase C-terminal domain-containing protein [Spirochaetales bacterium]|nr:alpha-glucosidase C-terminal domain-containing protein [Spirochaetales bacterium]
MQSSKIRDRIMTVLKKKACGHDDYTAFSSVLAIRFHAIYDLYMDLYGQHPDCYLYLEKLIFVMWTGFIQRRAALRLRDRNTDTHWYLDNSIIGGMIYVDLFSGNLKNLEQRIDYLENLGINYLHLMPLYARPSGMNDGGYAVSSYRTLQNGIGTSEQLSDLADLLHRRDIYLTIDFILNHVSEDHEWARMALSGNAEYRRYFYIFESRREVEEYQRSLRDIFPSLRNGSFTYNNLINAWIWTTFHSFQWDLNYSNPAVFVAMAEEMLYLANLGADVLRFDALAFIWKEKGSSCENLPKAHTLIQAFKAVCRTIAPLLAFKSEAIVHPDYITGYIQREECELSYNPLLMALSWEALATRKTGLLQHSISRRFHLDRNCAWVNYIRSHDDIGWTFSDEDASGIGIHAYDHRKFLNDFYTGLFPGSFARGLPFQENPQTGDLRVCGTCASLAGLEKALKEETATEVDLAIKRILLLYSVVFSIGGIPLLYLGDESAVLNNYAYTENPAWKEDSRWVHRVPVDWTAVKSLLHSEATGNIWKRRVYDGIRNLGILRRKITAFSGNRTEFPPLSDPHLFSYKRIHENEYVQVVANFSEQQLSVDLSHFFPSRKKENILDLLTNETVPLNTTLDAYRVLWLQ